MVFKKKNKKNSFWEVEARGCEFKASLSYEMPWLKTQNSLLRAKFSEEGDNSIVLPSYPLHRRETQMRALKGWVLGVGLSDKHRLPPLHFKCVFMCGVWGCPCIYKHTRGW